MTSATGMDIALLVKDYLSILLWPSVILILALIYRRAIFPNANLSSLTVDLFGVKIEMTLQQIQEVLTVTWDRRLDTKQWTLLEDLHASGNISVEARGYSMGTGSDLEWIRPLRNAGLIMTLPDGHFIEESRELSLTPLGKALMKARGKQLVSD